MSKLGNDTNDGIQPFIILCAFSIHYARHDMWLQDVLRPLRECCNISFHYIFS
jgi:hypothetical protein